MTPYYEQDGISIYHGDCREVLPTLNLSAHWMILTDPPYGVSTLRGDQRLTAAIHDDDKAFDPSHLMALNIPSVIFGANNFANQLPASTGWLIWDKTHADGCEHSQAELAWTNFVKGIRIYRWAYHGFMRKEDGWLHPTQKPVNLMAWILSLRWTPKDAGILDPYCGSGPVLIAAKQCGRRAIGIEIDERYCEIAANRLRQGVLFGAKEAV